MAMTTCHREYIEGGWQPCVRAHAAVHEQYSSEVAPMLGELASLWAAVQEVLPGCLGSSKFGSNLQQQEAY